MAVLGPFEPAPLLAVGVSGGADSMALAWLADRWARGLGGRIICLIVDHGLRREAAGEAVQTAAHLMSHGIAADILRLDSINPGPDLAARARTGRYGALEAACAARGVLHLLVAHHAADQAETIAMRMLAGSDADGLAGMAGLVPRHQVSLLRPLLGMSPASLRAVLCAAGWPWVEDPSNRDPRWQRALLRGLRRDAAGRGPATRALAHAAGRRAQDRAVRVRATAGELASKVAFFPEGFAVLAPGPIGVAALRAVLRTIAGRRYAASVSQVAGLAAAPRACTIAGVRLLAAGRLGPAGALLVVREPAAMAGRVGQMWDARLRMTDADAPDRPDLPFAVRRTLPVSQAVVFEPPTPAT
jgi:tRNA(Ile)-lysidine synthase